MSVFFSLALLLIPMLLFSSSVSNPPEERNELSLTVLTHICDHLIGPIALKVYVAGGAPGYTLEADTLIVGQLSVHEFVILGLRGDDGGCSVIVTDALGNSAEFWAAPILMPTPGAEAGPDEFISCEDSVAVLHASSDTSIVRYYWSGPDPDFDNEAINPKVCLPGLYHLEVVNTSNGCRSYDSTSVFLPDHPEFEYSYLDLSCYGDSSGMIEFDHVLGGIAPYSFSIDGGQSFQNAAVFEELEAGAYELILKDQLGCTADSLMVELSEPDSISLELGPSLHIFYGQQVALSVETNLEPDEIASISWTPDNGLSCDDCLEPLARPENSITYQLELSDLNGCRIRDTLFIEVEKDIDVYIPNVFSPNGDGRNETFYIEAANGVTKIKSMEIYNRWGNKVFSSKNAQPNDPASGWDGSYQGRTLPSGVYVFISVLEYYNTKEVVISGEVTLLR